MHNDLLRTRYLLYYIFSCIFFRNEISSLFFCRESSSIFLVMVIELVK